MSRALLACAGGRLSLPGRELVLCDAADGGHLVIDPPRPCWERSELAPAELVAWSFLVAASGRAMLDVVPALAGGCVNYWEAGNWSLHHDAVPAGPKTPEQHRRVHLHLLGRSPRAGSSSMRWGEAPTFPDFADRLAWARGHVRLAPELTRAIVARVAELLVERYAFDSAAIAPSDPCPRCGHPRPASEAVGPAGECAECAPGGPEARVR